MSDASMGTVLADTNSLVYAYRAGGTDLLNAYVATARMNNLKLEISATPARCRFPRTVPSLSRILKLA